MDGLLSQNNQNQMGGLLNADQAQDNRARTLPTIARTFLDPEFWKALLITRRMQVPLGEKGQLIVVLDPYTKTQKEPMSSMPERSPFAGIGYRRRF